MAMPAPLQTPGRDTYSPIPQSTDPIFLKKGYGRRSSSRPNSWAIGSSNYNVADPSTNPHNGRFHEELDSGSQRSSLNLDGSVAASVRRSFSGISRTSSVAPSGSTTLKKKGSIRRSGSRKSMRPGSVRSLKLSDKEKYRFDTDDINSAFYVPIPTSGNPTETLANRFQGISACHVRSGASVC